MRLVQRKHVKRANAADSRSEGVSVSDPAVLAVCISMQNRSFEGRFDLSPRLIETPEHRLSHSDILRDGYREQRMCFLKQKYIYLGAYNSIENTCHCARLSGGSHLQSGVLHTCGQLVFPRLRIVHYFIFLAAKFRQGITTLDR